MKIKNKIEGEMLLINAKVGLTITKTKGLSLSDSDFKLDNCLVKINRKIAVIYTTTEKGLNLMVEDLTSTDFIYAEGTQIDISEFPKYLNEYKNIANKLKNNNKLK